MTNQPQFEGMEPALGRMREQTFNIALTQPPLLSARQLI